MDGKTQIEFVGTPKTLRLRISTSLVKLGSVENSLVKLSMAALANSPCVASPLIEQVRIESAEANPKLYSNSWDFETLPFAFDGLNKCDTKHEKGKEPH